MSDVSRWESIRAYALKQVGNPYVWGAMGEKCTIRMRKAKIKQYPARAAAITASCPGLKRGLNECPADCKHRGKLAFDCSQLVRKAYEQAGVKLPSGASSQWRRGPWVEKGPIENMPKDRECAVFRESPSSNPMVHVGQYLGDGSVVDARGSNVGVVHQPLGKYPWTHYAIDVEPGSSKVVKPVEPTEIPLPIEKRVYTTVRGDTLWKISTKFLGRGARYREIMRANNMKSTVIRPGMKLVIPG